MKTLVDFINESVKHPKGKRNKKLNLDKKTLMDIKNHKYKPKNKKFFDTLIKKTKINETLSREDRGDFLEEFRYFASSTLDEWSDTWERYDDMTNDLDDWEYWFDENFEQWAKETIDLSQLSDSEYNKLEELARNIFEDEVNETKSYYGEKFDDGRYSYYDDEDGDEDDDW